MSGGGIKVRLALIAGVGFLIVNGQHAHHGHHHHGGGSVQSVSDTHISGHSNRALGERMAARKGWTGAQWGCLDELWTGESNWDKYNTYPSHDTPPSTPGYEITTAYGIPQSLPAQKMASAGSDWQTSARTQIRWGLAYIERTYGTPCGALSFKRSHGNKGY